MIFNKLEGRSAVIVTLSISSKFECGMCWTPYEYNLNNKQKDKK
jgi:hypothetical protein